MSRQGIRIGVHAHPYDDQVRTSLSCPVDYR